MRTAFHTLSPWEALRLHSAGPNDGLNDDLFQSPIVIRRQLLAIKPATRRQNID
jgi:hypothetical protein